MREELKNLREQWEIIKSLGWENFSDEETLQIFRAILCAGKRMLKILEEKGQDINNMKEILSKAETIIQSLGDNHANNTN